MSHPRHLPSERASTSWNRAFKQTITRPPSSRRHFRRRCGHFSPRYLVGTPTTTLICQLGASTSPAAVSTGFRTRILQRVSGLGRRHVGRLFGIWHAVVDRRTGIRRRIPGPGRAIAAGSASSAAETASPRRRLRLRNKPLLTMCAC